MFEKNPQLQYHTVPPRRVHESGLVKAPAAFLERAGATTFLCPWGEAHLLLDFDGEMVGGLEVTLTCTADTHVRIDYEEHPTYALRKEPLTCNWYQLVVDEYDLTAGTHTLRSKGRRGFRFVNITVTGSENVRLDEVQAINGGWPVTPRGMFRCSDDRLNRIWDISAATARACMQTFYEDGVKRDGLLWLGDYRFTFPGAWYAFGDSELALRSLRMIRDSQYPCGAIPACAARGGGEQHHTASGIAYMPNIPGDGQNRWIIPNYMCDYISGLREYVALTGDEAVLPEFLDSARRAAEFLLDLVDFERPGHWRFDPYTRDRDAYGFNYTIHMDVNISPQTGYGSKGALLMELLAAVRALANLADMAGDEALSGWAMEQSQKLDCHIETYYRERRFGSYTDEVRQRFTGINQYVAPRAALVGKVDELGIQRMLRSVMPRVGFSMAWRLEAMFHLGYIDEALKDIRATWGKMLDQDSRTCWERLDVPEMNETHWYDAIGSYCHGWTSGPAWQLPKWITGVQAQGTGFRLVTVAPRLGDLTWAEATVPTPDGELFVRAERVPGGMTVTVDLPAAVQRCILRSPDGREQTVTSGVYTLNI